MFAEEGSVGLDLTENADKTVVSVAKVKEGTQVSRQTSADFLANNDGRC